MKVIALRQLPVATKPGSSVYKPVAAGKVEMSDGRRAGRAAHDGELYSYFLAAVLISGAHSHVCAAARSAMRRVVIFSGVQLLQMSKCSVYLH